MKSVNICASFFPPERGGRKLALIPEAWGHYMPHLRVEGHEELLGVRFLAGPREATEFSKDYEFGIEFMYSGVDYSRLIPGTEFEVLEGLKVVAKGMVLSD
ncbi:MAG TPA: hypothetical protein VNV60_00565 [Holophagaceae bacterium]|jgi:hypothetical protein|nr:hypothetical protein [Holophagaceae bacterium]